jgi:hypothetical protein
MQKCKMTTTQPSKKTKETMKTEQHKKKKKTQKNQSKMTIELYADRLLMPKLGPLLDAWQEDKKNLKQKDLVTVEQTL